MNQKGGNSINLQKEGWLPQEEKLEVAKLEQKMVIGIPREDTGIESRVPLTPEAVEILTAHGHQVILHSDAGKAANYPDNQYAENGAMITDQMEEVYAADLVLKISPPKLKEISMLKERNTLISSFQVNTHKDIKYIEKLIQRKTTAISLERIQDEHRCYPFIRSMSGIAGNTAVLIAAEYLSNARGGKGVMLGGIAGITPTEVVILGAGTAAEHAVRAALGLGAFVKVFDNSVHRLRRLQGEVGQNIPTSIFHPRVIEKALRSADVVIGAVRTDDDAPGFFITEDMVKVMKKGSVIVDISIDQGGCVATSEVRNQKDPVFTKHGVIHYCVPNIPSRVSRTSSIAISNVFLPLVKSFGRYGGIHPKLKEDVGLRHGVYIYNGILTNEKIGARFGIPSKDIDLLIAAF
jgi:alanine dehydrogenase